MYIPNVYTNALQCIYPMYIGMHYNVYTGALQCIYLISIVYRVDIHWVAPPYTLGCTPIYILLYFMSHNVYSYMLPNVYTHVTQRICEYTFGIYIGEQVYIHWVTCHIHCVTFFCHTMYIQ